MSASATTAVAPETTRKRPASIMLTDEERDYLGKMAHLIILVVLEKSHGPKNWKMWDELTLDQQARFKRYAISGLTEFRKSMKGRGVTVQQAIKECARLDKAEREWTDNERMMHHALKEQVRVMREAEARTQREFVRMSEAQCR